MTGAGGGLHEAQPVLVTLGVMTMMEVQTHHKHTTSTCGFVEVAVILFRAAIMVVEKEEGQREVQAIH